MIHWSNLLKVLGFFILALSLSLVFPLAFALWNGDAGLLPLTASVVLSTAIGLVLILSFRPEPTGFNNRDGILLVILTWCAAGLIGALPFYFSASFHSFTDAVFESVSGFTTTGATILSDIESLPKSLLLWRSFTQWVGGMGIILLGIAILPLIGAGGMELYRAEFSGASSEKLKPRIAETALSLWQIYAAFSVFGYVAFRLAGMEWFDAVCHSLTSLATGGFSTRNQSIEAFNSPGVEWVMVACMVIGGINFTQHYRLLVERRPRPFVKDPEIRFYILMLFTASTIVAGTLYVDSQVMGMTAIRQAIFQVVSIMTGSGFSSADFELWTPFAQLILLALMFVGGCTGSTTGGLKVARIVLLLRVVGREFRKIVERRGVFAVRLNGKAVSESAIQGLLNLIYLAFIINFSACLALTAFGVDVLTAISAVAAAMFNIGPGLGEVGPSDHYGLLAAPVKWVLAFCMVAGRLEYYTLLVICTRAFWRK